MESYRQAINHEILNVSLTGAANWINVTFSQSVVHVTLKSRDGQPIRLRYRSTDTTYFTVNAVMVTWEFEPVDALTVCQVAGTAADVCEVIGDW